MMTHDKHVLACALWVEKNHGDRAAAFIEKRIGQLALQGDEAGVTMWNEIAAAYERLAADDARKLS